MGKCLFYEEIFEKNFNEFLGEDEMGYSIYNSEPVLIGVFCTKYDMCNPDCSTCSQNRSS